MTGNQNRIQIKEAISTGFTNLTEFECKEASDCISNNKVCDGIKDCADGSDEESCYNYKAKSSNCVLPPYTNHGSYEVFNLPKYRLKDLGQPFESFMLKLRCDPGYIVEPGYGLDVNGTWELFCNNGVWSQTMPQCVRKLLRSARMMDINQKSFCKLDPDPSVHYMCSEKVCNNSVPAGTIVNPICNYPIYIPTEGQKLVYMTCNAGVWDHIVRCEADCGRVTPIGVGLVIDGKPVIHGELPSHVGIYRKPRPYKQICGGSLISNDVVISAAHCFWGATEVQPASNFIVAVGKLYREWYDKRDNDAQKSHVIKIIIPSLFGGATASFQEDIAALILRTSVTYKLYVRPVCISYNDIFDRLQLQDGNLGKVAGWGLTGANGDFSPYLKVVQMPFINEATCINTLPSTFRPYVTGDKFCAGYTNGTGVCKGDSGGGLVFSEYSQGLDRYYLRGVVSTAPPTEGQRCNDKSYTTFTKITKHQDLIQNALAEAYTLKRCEPGQGEYCSPNPEFVDDLDELNKSSEEVEGSTKPGDCILPPYPTYGTYQAFPNARPGAALDSFVLTVCCRKGFDLVDPDSGNETSNQVHCINGTYQQKMPKCTRFCQLNPDASVRYLCPVPGGGSETCRKYVAPGTMVTVICNEPMYSNRYHIENTSKCNSSGYFDYLLSCEVECGRETFESGPSVNGANAAKKGEVPWHVGIYQKTTTPYQQICGGTIIRNNLVLSSTVCFLANDMKTLHPTSNYAVAAGKLYREWNSDRDADAQTSDIKDLKTASEGVYFLRSIAIIVLETPFVYTPYIRPVCLLNLQVISILLLIKTKPDKVAGWGLTSANGNASDFLQITTLVSAKDCLRDVKSYIEYYDSWDKGCARHFSGKPICDGDSGGGLTFSDQLLDYNYIKRYYLKGIVSTAPIDEDKKCTDRAPISFTKVFNHGEFIHEVIENYTEKKCNQSEFRCDDGSCAPQGADCNGVRQCKDGSDEADELCIPVFKL